MNNDNKRTHSLSLASPDSPDTLRAKRHKENTEYAYKHGLDKLLRPEELEALINKQIVKELEALLNKSQRVTYHSSFKGNHDHISKGSTAGGVPTTAIHDRIAELKGDK